MNWQKMEWPLPPHIVPRAGQYALYFFPEEGDVGSVCLTYWDETIPDFRYVGDVAHIYGGREPSHIMLIDSPK